MSSVKISKAILICSFVLPLGRGLPLPELEANALQQGNDFMTADYRKRIANYLPNNYA